ncbi:hypothetical protein [Siccibacter turicensis]|nr:hypothetical protein [Siccibacter turicensis]
MKIKMLAVVLAFAVTGCTQTGSSTLSASRLSAPKPAVNNTSSGAVQNTTTTASSTSLSQPAVRSDNDNSAQADPAMKARLNSCLVEAKQLAKLRNGAYRASVDELYRNLRATQSYASIAGELSTSTTDLMTPLYQYRVNDSCNTISQLLLKELKKGAMINGN